MRQRRYPTPVFVTALLLIGMGCSQGGGSGCGCGATPLPANMDEADKVYDGLVAEVTPAGFSYVEQNFTPILESFLAGGLNFDLPAGGGLSCPTFGCNSGQVICKGGAPCPLNAAVHDIGLSTVAPNKLHIAAMMDVNSGAIPIKICQNLGICASVSCDINVHVANKSIGADVVFGVDPIMKTTTFALKNLDVALSKNDFSLNGGALCNIADWGFIKGFIANYANNALMGQIDSQVQGQIDSMTCMPCDFFSAGCTAGVGNGSTCDGGTNWCMNPNTGSCVRAPMGIVGTVDVGQMLGSLTGGAPAPVDLFVAPGQQADASADPFVPANDGPLQLRMIGGASSTPSPCVPEASSLPATDSPPRVDFTAEAAAAGVPSFMTGVGVSDRFLDKFFYELYRGGGLCLNIGSDTVDLVSSGLFKTFLPSLDSLTEGKNTPMIIALRPKDRPTVDIGAGTFHDDNGTTVIDDPLLTIHLNKLQMDFYAMMEERYVRLFTLEMDLALPLALEFTASNQLVPILGDLGSLVSNIKATHSEILAEDPAVLEDIIPAIIGLIEPLLSSALAPIALPDLQGFALDVKKIGGMVPRPSEPGHFEHLGILADLAFTAATPATLKVQTQLRVLGQTTPPAELMRPRLGHPLARPSVELSVVGFDARKASPGVEWQYRVDGGFWSPFNRTGILEVSPRQLMLPGRHRLEARARSVDDYRTLDPTPASAELLIDWTAPQARLLVDPASGHVRVEAQDDVTPRSLLRYAFALDGGSFGAFSKNPTTQLPEDSAQAFVEVQVEDEAGNVKSLRWRSSAQFASEAGGRAREEMGCSSGFGGGSALALGLLFLAALGLRPRRPRTGEKRSQS